METRFTDVSAKVTVTMFKVKEYWAQTNQKLRTVTCTRERDFAYVNGFSVLLESLNIVMLGISATSVTSKSS